MSISGINTFSELLRRASDISKVMKRNGKRPKEVGSVLDVCATTDKPRKRGYKAMPPPRNYKSRSEVPSILIPRAQVMEIMAGWFEDGMLRARDDRNALTEE